jgi:hypothetical protein
VIVALLGLGSQDTANLTAVGTLLLATATSVSVIFAGWALRHSRTEIDEMLRQGERAHRPVLIPVADHRRMELGALGTMERAPRLNDGKLLIVPLENIGPGPALNVCGYAMRLDAADVRPRPVEQAKGQAKVVGVAQGSFFPLEIEVPAWPSNASFELSIVYEDVVGNGWNTRGKWDGEGRTWADVDIEPADGR